jgi:5'-methylthioadenosine phosphorylase
MWGGDVINMTTVPEVVLAREAGLHYAAVAVPTDYDCWKIGESAVDVSIVMKTFKENVAKVQNLLLMSIPEVDDYLDCRCKIDYKNAVQSK